MPYIGGRGGIRTHGSIAATPDFESGTFDHSATLPKCHVFIYQSRFAEVFTTSTSACYRILLPLNKGSERAVFLWAPLTLFGQNNGSAVRKVTGEISNASGSFAKDYRSRFLGSVQRLLGMMPL
jgi:hypothetical protein